MHSSVRARAGLPLSVAIPANIGAGPRWVEATRRFGLAAQLATAGFAALGYDPPQGLATEKTHVA